MIHQNRARDIIFLSLQMLILFIFFTFPNLNRFVLSRSWYRIGVLLVLIGFAVSIIGALTLNEVLSPYVSPSPKGKLITTGIYKKVRHPIYLGIIILLLGFTLIFSSVSKLVLFLIAIVFFVKKAFEEERLLLQRYPKYKNYKQKTGMFFPKILPS